METTLSSVCRKIFDDIPCDYKIRSIIPKATNYSEHSQINAMLIFYKKDTDSKSEIESEIRYYGLFYHSLEYIVSAYALRNAFHDSYKKNKCGIPVFNPNYCEPCCFLCRHAIELKLKEFLYSIDMSHLPPSTHLNEKLWSEVKKELLQYNCAIPKGMENFINEVSHIDKDGSHLRYMFSKNGNIYNDKSYNYDIDSVVDNTKFFFNYMQMAQLKIKSQKEKTSSQTQSDPIPHK